MLTSNVHCLAAWTKKSELWRMHSNERMAQRTPSRRRQSLIYFLPITSKLSLLLRPIRGTVHRHLLARICKGCTHKTENREPLIMRYLIMYLTSVYECDLYRLEQGKEEGNSWPDSCEIAANSKIHELMSMAWWTALQNKHKPHMDYMSKTEEINHKRRLLWPHQRLKKKHKNHNRINLHNQ